MPDRTIVDILRADEAIWFVVTAILLGLGAPILHRYNLQRVLIWIAFGWFVLGALLLGCRGRHLRGSIGTISGRSLHSSAM